MVLKPQDILVLLKLVAIGQEDWAYHSVATELGMSPAEVHAALKRALSAQLAVQENNKIRPLMTHLEEFLIHGLKYVFVPERGELTRGMATSVAASPLQEVFNTSNEPPPIWPDPAGDVRGMAFSPLYKAAPTAARRDPFLYELLVLVDAIRGGRARERTIAIKELKRRLRKQ